MVADRGVAVTGVAAGHDPNDYEIGKRHSLPIINIMNRDASINENGGAYQGLDRFECRDKLWADMEAAGLTIKVARGRACCSSRAGRQAGHARGRAWGHISLLGEGRGLGCPSEE